MKNTCIFKPLEMCELSRIQNYLEQQPIFSTNALTPFFIADQQFGWLEQLTLTELLNFSTEWQFTHKHIELNTPSPSTALQAAALHLQQRGLIQGWRNENYGVFPEGIEVHDNFAHPLCALERASFRRFGLISRAVHINAYYPDGSISLGLRSPSKSIDPNKLDNIAAGGIPIGESAYQCAIRELFEEAGVQAELAQQIQFTERMHIRRNESDGTHNEILYCFDLALPADFEPKNQDGEVAKFYRLKPADVVQQLEQMTWDAGKVTASFLLRHSKEGA